MIFLRVSKYNPIYRDKGGVYSKDEWTSYSDIGKCFCNKTFTIEDYEDVETAYINTILKVSNAIGVKKFTLISLEKNKTLNELDHLSEGQKKCYSHLEENMRININEITITVKLLLREVVWGKLISENLVIHFGYDYYMYLGVKNINIQSVKSIINENHLYYEKKNSPYEN